MNKIYYKKIDYENFVNYIVFYAVMIVLDANKSNKVSVGKTSLYFISEIYCIPKTWRVAEIAKGNTKIAITNIRLCTYRQLTVSLSCGKV